MSQVSSLLSSLLVNLRMLYPCSCTYLLIFLKHESSSNALVSLKFHRNKGLCNVRMKILTSLYFCLSSLACPCSFFYHIVFSLSYLSIKKIYFIFSTYFLSSEGLPYIHDIVMIQIIARPKYLLSITFLL